MRSSGRRWLLEPGGSIQDQDRDTGLRIADVDFRGRDDIGLFATPLQLEYEVLRRRFAAASAL
jgi:hypothetical protein